MSQEFDVFADLYNDDNEEKAKFLQALNSKQTDLLNYVSSDEDDMLPPSFQMKGKGRAKKTKPPPSTKGFLILKEASPAKKTKSNAPQMEVLNPPVASSQSINAPGTASRRRTRSSAAGPPPDAQTTTTLASSSVNNVAPVRGRRGRSRAGRGRGGGRGGEANSNIVENVDATMAVTESLGLFAETMRGQTTRNVMRARRDYFAEIAARSTNVAYVDLVSSPMPRIEGVVTVDSDAEDSKSSNSVEIRSPGTPSSSFVDTLECSFDEDNPEVSVKIKWDGGNPEIFKLRKHQKFQDIFIIIADREQEPIDNLVFNIENRIISAGDTPASINYKVYEFISGRALSDDFDMGARRKKRNANIIMLKIQSDLWPKRPLKVELNKTDKLKILYIKCAEELKMPAEDLILSFNGDHLGFNETPEDFEFEGDEAVDLRIKKK
ncbi:unnamed protein product [Ceratitis capitata]|uniref:(Mediterranean fruit fly) hypothetical protein n=1 Tax=Ceratitis capitata TaxID=7213 RepID=W8C146_CERCA|nr:unnamed protein product [Ceratitis capitata]